MIACRTRDYYSVLLYSILYEKREHIPKGFAEAKTVAHGVCFFDLGFFFLFEGLGLAHEQ